MAKQKISNKDFRKPKLLVLDFDGVMTNNKVYVDESGREMVCCSRSDGLGIERLRKAGIKTWVLSKERNKVVRTRCKKLKIRCVQGVDDKLKRLKKMLKDKGISPLQVAYLGNDINDIECVKLAGLGCAVRDSHPDLFKAANYVTKNKGGDGAVREVCELIVRGLI